ncbi:glycosyltransferase [Algoriphagus halophilus]|uniref:Glycosyltransferase involved in cell wall bisynthesis n=1 Tax=Algoriphagus halophilus TaxID=226505 RepID=A0A1N6EBS5_9BACT|nr:glycosyltransferase [Algoriphagus halophilus]SIN80453.1 Glycosyltransferase involved in cell wall bisynthesis [Algoriphagus halophilus]
MKNILQIQFSTKSAGSSAWRLHTMFNSIPGCSSEIISLYRDDEPKEGITYLPSFSLFKSKVNNKLEKLLFRYDKEKYGMFSNPILGTSICNHPSFKKASIIYIHWVQLGVLTLNELVRIVKSGKKIVFVLHDMWGITGGCHNAMDCNQYITGCENCPIFDNQKSVIKSQVEKKKWIYAQSNVSFISPSRWLADRTKESYVAKGCDVRYIPNYFDIKCFTPSGELRELEPSEEESKPKIISFAAANIFSVYKGFIYLVKALEYLPQIYPNPNVEIQVIGEGELGELSSIPYKIHRLGYLKEEEDMANALQASDLFVIPSVMENQPTIIIESLSCGVPVVGFKIGGIPDMILHKENGYLAEPVDYKDLAEGIKYCLENKLRGFKLDNFQPEYVLDKHLSFLKEA